MNDADDQLFSSILGNHHHVLQHFLADNPDTVYNLRPRKHNKTAELSTRNFLLYTLYQDCYWLTTVYPVYQPMFIQIYDDDECPLRTAHMSVINAY